MDTLVPSSIYYSDNDGIYPCTETNPGAWSGNATYLAAALVPNYIKEIPSCYVPPYHPATSVVDHYPSFTQADAVCDGEWGYVGNRSESELGHIFVECWHTDVQGKNVYEW